LRASPSTSTSTHPQGLLGEITSVNRQHCSHIIFECRLWSLESFFWVFNTYILFECGRYCPSNRSFGPAAPWYSSSAGYLVPRSTLLIFFECKLSYSSKRTAYIIRVRTILSLESLFQVFRAFVLLECGRSVPRIFSSGL
jgi:hypothetical protein